MKIKEYVRQNEDQFNLKPKVKRTRRELEGVVSS